MSTLTDFAGNVILIDPLSGALKIDTSSALNIQGLKLWLDSMTNSLEIFDDQEQPFLRVVDSDTKECYLIRKL